MISLVGREWEKQNREMIYMRSYCLPSSESGGACETVPETYDSNAKEIVMLAF